MMKRIFITLLIIFFFSKIYSQSYYTKMYDIYNGWESVYNIVEIDNVSKTILFNGDFFNPIDTNYDSLRQNHIHNFILDFNGNLLHNFILGKKGYNYYTGWPSLRINNENYLFIREDDTINIVKYLLYRLDSLGNFKNRTQIIGTSNTLHIKKIKQVAEKVYAFGFNGNVWGSPFAALCFDTTGKQLWYKVYNNKRVYPTGTALTSDGHFLIGGVESVSDGGFKDSLFAWFAKLDTLGNIIWQKKIPNINNLSVSNISPIEINSIYYWFGGYPSSQKDLSLLAYSYLIKTNSNGDIISNKKIIEGISARHDYMVCHLGFPLFKNNYVYMLGQASDTISYVKYNDYIQFCKLDTLGNIKWRRTFSQWYMSNRPFSLTAVPDGFIICADGKDTTHTTGFTDAWIIKTDTNGCIIPGCHLSDGITEVVDAQNYVKVYPNPANTQITITFIDPRQTQIDFIEVLNSQGISLQTIKVNSSECTLNTSHLPNGLYYIAAYFNGNKRVVKKVLVQH